MANETKFHIARERAQTAKPGVSRKRILRFCKGFTMVELLVVLAILVLLLSMVFVQLSSSRARARDAEREEEINQIQNAFAIYVVDNKNYPIYTGNLDGTDAVSVALVAAGTLPQMPTDPLNSDPYIYSYSSAAGYTYTITYSLETDTISGKSAGINTAAP